MRLASVIFVTSILSGCVADSSSGDDDDLAAEDAKADGSSIAGYYQFQGEPLTYEWIDSINLHSNNTFEAVMGNNVSNLSGHRYVASGTYTFTGGVLTLHMVADVIGPHTMTYHAHATGGALQLQQTGADPFSIAKKPIVSLTFKPDYTVTQSGPLHAGEALLVRYAESRASCTNSDGVFVTPFETVDGGLQAGTIREFNRHAVNHYLGALGFVPAQGNDLTLWFDVGSVDNHDVLLCSHWDSSFGKNYHFQIVP